MRYFFPALLALFTIVHPARADMRTMTLQGHQYYFDVPSGYDESDATDHSETFKSPMVDTEIVFSVVFRNLQQQMDLYDAKFQRDYLFDGRVGRAMGIGSDRRSFFSSVFATSCSGTCVIGIIVGGAAGNAQNKPFDFEQARSLLDSYANQLGRGGFGGD